MSRTIRRKKKWMATRHFGTFETLFVVESFNPTGETYSAWQARRRNLSNEKYYEQLLAEFHSDRRSMWLGSAPRWYRHMTGSHQNRVNERAKIIRGMKSGEWDNHAPESRTRGQNYYW